LLGEKLKTAIASVNRPSPKASPTLDPKRPSIQDRSSVAPHTPLNRANSVSRHDSYHHSPHHRRYAEDSEIGESWDRYDSRRYSRSSRGEDYHRNSNSRILYDDGYGASSRYRDSSRHKSYHHPPLPYGSSRYGSPRHSPQRSSRWNGTRSPSMSSPDSRYRSRSRSRSRSIDRRDSYYSSRWEGEPDYRSRRYWEDHHRRPSYEETYRKARPILAISRKCLPFVRGVLEDLKKMFYYYNCIDVRWCR
jgi:hypothetical protein